MRQQRQQAALDRQFNAWKTQYGHNSAMARMKADYQYRGVEQDKGFTNSLKSQRMMEEAREEAARRSRLFTADQEATRAKNTGLRDEAIAKRSLFNKMFDENLSNLNPAGDAQAMKLWAAHEKRVSKGTLAPQQVEQDRQEMLTAITDLYNNPANRSKKGTPGWSESRPNANGIYHRSYVTPDGTPRIEYTAHPDTGWEGTMAQLRTQFREEEEEREPFMDPTSGKMMKNVTGVKLGSSKEGGQFIELEPLRVEVKTADQIRRDRQTSYTTAFLADTEKEKIDTGETDDDSGKPITEEVTKVRDPDLRRQLIEEYGPPRADFDPLIDEDPGGDLRWATEGTPEYEAGLVEHLEAKLREEFKLNAPRKAPKPQLKRGAPAARPAPVQPQPAPRGGPGMGLEPEPQPAGQENQLVKQAGPEQQVEQHLATLQKAGWNNPTVTAVQRVRQMLLENAQEFPPEKSLEIKKRMAARTQAVLWAMQQGVPPIAPINQDPALIEQEIERLISPALPGLGGGPLGGR